MKDETRKITVTPCKAGMVNHATKRNVVTPGMVNHSTKNETAKITDCIWHIMHEDVQGIEREERLEENSIW